jgi:long-chain acyl-CoA synthetase
MNLAEWLTRTAQRVPAAPALFHGEHMLADYATFAARTARLAGGLRDRFGIGPGARVALMMSNRVEYLESMYAAWFAGAAVVPVNAKLHPREAAWIIEHAEATVALVSDDAAGSLAPLIERSARAMIAVESRDFALLRTAEPMTAAVVRGRDDLAWLFYTSGTTGKPKGVMISNGNLHAMASSYFVDVDAVYPGDAVLYSAPLSHGAGLYNFMGMLRGSRHVIPESGGFDPAEVLSLARSLRDVTMFAAPTMVRRLLDRARADGSNGDGIRTVVYGGGPMYVSDIEEAVAVMGPRFVQIYGQGESPMTITVLAREIVADRSHPRWRERLGSVGVAQSCVAVRVGDRDGQPLAPGETGEILVRGAPVMLGYWRDAEATGRTIRDGWLWTGDMGALDADGFLTLKDRSKDVIISGGSNVYPREVEEVLLLHPSLQEVSVVGRPSREWGEDVVAFVVPKPGVALDLADLDRLCLEHIARFKRPKCYFVEAELPKNNYGKVLKTELRARLATSSI